MLASANKNTDNVRILIIHRYFWPENIAVLPIMLKDIVSMHTDAGHSVEVVCGSTIDNKDVWSAEFGDSVKVSSFEAKIDRNLSSAGRSFNIAKLAFYGVKAIMFGGKRDLVYLVSYPPFHAGLMILCSKIFRRATHHVYYVQDNHEYLIGSRLLKKLYVSYTQLVIRKCSKVITLSNAMKQQLLKGMTETQIRENAATVEVVQNYSTDLPPLNSIDSTGNEADKKIDVIYAGNHGKAQNLFYFIDLVSASKLAKAPVIHFYGTGTEKSSLAAYAKQQDVEIKFCDPVDRVEISKLIRSAKLGLVAAQPGLMNFAFPSKLAAYNSAGTKALVMCETNSSLGEWLSTNELGFTIDPTKLEEGILQLETVLASNLLLYSQNNLIHKSHELYGKDAYVAKMVSCVGKLVPLHDKHEQSVNQ